MTHTNKILSDTAAAQACIDNYYMLLSRLSERTLHCRFAEAERRFNRLQDRRDCEVARHMARLKYAR